jgi:hypothetical protein
LVLTHRPDLNDHDGAVALRSIQPGQWQLSIIPASKAAIPLPAEAV